MDDGRAHGKRKGMSKHSLMGEAREGDPPSFWQERRERQVREAACVRQAVQQRESCRGGDEVGCGPKQD